MLKLLGLAIAAYFVAKWLFRDSLRTFLGKLEKRSDRIVKVTLVALLLVYCLRIALLWLGVPEEVP